MSKIQDEIKAEMKRQGLTYVALADRLGESRMNVWIKLNRDGNPNLESIQKFSKALGRDFKVGE